MDNRPGNILYAALLLIFLLGLKSCVPSITATSQFDRSIDFEIYQTFALMKPEAPNTSADPTLFEPLLDRRIRESITAELVKRGLRPDAENPDLLIAYDVAVPKAENVVNDPNAPGLGYSYWYGYRYNYNTAGFPGYRSINSYPPGTIVIDIIVPNTNQLVWRGIAEGDINPSLTEERKIRRAIAGIILQYPNNQPPL